MIERNVEVTQLLIPAFGDVYETFDITDLVLSESGLGAAPHRFITQRGVVQDGETVISNRLDPRTIQCALTEDLGSRVDLWSRRFGLHDKLTLNRNFAVDGTVTPCVYRKIIGGGKRKWRSDLVTTAGSAIITSASATFAHWGVQAGSTITILTGADAGDHIVASVTNENTVVLTVVLGATAANIQYRIITGPIIRDVDVLIQRGPQFPDDKREWRTSYSEVLRFVAYDPLIYNPLEQQLVVLLDEEANLIFYESPNYTDRAVFPIWFSGDDVFQQESLTYVGTWRSRPRIVVTGPFTYFEVENTSTGDEIAMLYTAAVGETVTVDLAALRAYSSTGASLTYAITEDSDEISFGLYPDPTVQDGINVMAIYLVNGLINVSTVTLYWNARYIGI